LEDLEGATGLWVRGSSGKIASDGALLMARHRCGHSPGNRKGIVTKTLRCGRACVDLLAKAAVDQVWMG
jgi:hypothetical protein